MGGHSHILSRVVFCGPFLVFSSDLYFSHDCVVTLVLIATFLSCHLKKLQSFYKCSVPGLNVFLCFVWCHISTNLWHWFNQIVLAEILMTMFFFVLSFCMFDYFSVCFIHQFLFGYFVSGFLFYVYIYITPSAKYSITIPLLVCFDSSMIMGWAQLFRKLASIILC